MNTAANRTRLQHWQPCGWRPARRMRSKFPSRSRRPKQPQQAPPPELNITPTDERAFYEKVQRVTAFRSLRGLKIPPEVIAELGRGNGDLAVAALSSKAAAGDNDANIALVLVQHWCSAVGSQRAGDPKTAIAKLVQNQPEQRAKRVAGVIYAETRLHAARPRQLRQSPLRLHRHRSTPALVGCCRRCRERDGARAVPARSRQARGDAADRGEEELSAGGLQSSDQPADGRAARPDDRERRARSASCSRSQAARSRARNWISRTAWRSAATAIPPMR